MALTRFAAGHYDDAAQFAQFECWDGDPAAPWAAEAQNFIRGFVLERADTSVFKWCDAGQLVAVTAFRSTVVGLPVLNPEDHVAWHLEVIGIAVTHQGHGLSQQVLEETIDVMRERDPDRVLVTANVHHQNAPSIAALASVGITPLAPLDEHYWLFLGEI